MQRRQFFTLLTSAARAAVFMVSPLYLFLDRGWARLSKHILPADTDVESLRNRNPAHLDASNLPVTPIQQFKTMGLSNHDVNLQRWSLNMGGDVATPYRIDYFKLKELPVMERSVLLICPGVFAYHAHWKGVSVWHLLEKAGVGRRATHVDVSGPAGPYRKLQRFPVGEVQSGRVFLAHTVNNLALPQKHGFPLRTVAEGYHGYDWIKYVDRVAAVTAP